MIVDPPPPFAPRPEWVAFLKRMEQLAEQRPDDGDVARAIAEAREVLAE